MANTKTTKNTDKRSKNKVTPQQKTGLLARIKKFFTKSNVAPTPVDSSDELPKSEIFRFCVGAIIFVISSFILLSIVSHFFTAAEDSTWVEGERAHNWMGTLGLDTAKFFVNECWGVSSFFIPLFLLATSFRIMRIYKVRLWKWFLNCSVLMIWSSILMSFVFQHILDSLYSPIKIGGGIGDTQVDFLEAKIGSIGTFFIIVSVALGYLIYLSDKTIKVIRKIFAPVELIKSVKSKNNENQSVADDTGNDLDKSLEIDNNNSLEHDSELPESANEDTATTIEFNDIDVDSSKDTLTPNDENDTLDIQIVQGGTDQDEPVISDKSSENISNEQTMTVHKGKEEEEAHLDESRQLEPYDPKLDLENYKYPTLDLLKHYDVDTSIDMEEQQQNKNRIIQVLSDFGVKISSIKATVGPTITLYEITPAPGVRISKIRNLEDDIALSLSALGIRIIAPIPGKGTIGIEVPNARPQIVSMESIVNSRKFQETQFELPMALGKTITNEIYMVDLAKMPHLLVAGATGQGKSVGLNAILTSLLYKKHPAELKLVMVDPKKVEFSVYSPIINHFLAQVEGTEGDEPIITDVQKVVQTLKSLCVEMDNRYDLLKKAGARNLREYNEKFKSRHLNPENGHRFMPYIVVIIDEFGDLIMTAGKEIELPICRIAQLARAVGIHMIIATQRPTTNIITGTIKANFPGRMAFKVSAMVDSRTILDRAGAQQLVGKGDMLVLGGGSEPVRVQCAFVDTPEVEAITKYIACQQSYLGPSPLPPVAMEGEEADGPDVDMQNLDPMFEEVARLVVQTQQGSTSMIQRKFSIGYNRAGRLMDQLEVAGIVGPAHGSKPREVICISEEDLQFRLDNMR
ncbi:MAG: DNA translocase FtsK 4TM domain-containing protein [Bacteroidaceae bacterium]|nr:DNA translocase FtsK 4TM domain-containing protein [Bacteroidaceae bacterium]